jgi:hypothetical protein
MKEQFEHLPTPDELTENFAFQALNRMDTESEIKHIKGLIEDAKDPAVSLDDLMAEHAEYLNKFIQANSKEELVVLMEKELEELIKKDESLTALQN